MAPATHFSNRSFALVLALLSVAILASAGNYNPSSAAAVEPHPKPEAYHSGYVSTLELDDLKSKMRRYEQEPAAHSHSSGNRAYGPKPAELVHPQPSNYGFPVAVEGIVACRSGSDYYPLQGAMVRVICSGSEEEEHKVLCSTDERGYFYKAMPAYGGKPEMCKAYLEKSGSEKCSEPSDVNRGVNGAALSSYKILHDKQIKLYPVGPFFYSVKATSHGDDGNDDHSAAATSAKPYTSKSPAGY